MNTFPSIDQLFAPTPERPLLGVSVLLVEDSRYTSEALRLLCQKSGARIRRADCLSSARRHLKVFSPTIMLVDLGLPDGSGLDLIREVSAARCSQTTVLAISGDNVQAPAARSAGAKGFLVKPVLSLALFQQELLRHLHASHGSHGSHALWTVPEENVSPDTLAFMDDMRHAADTLTISENPSDLKYIGKFVGGVAHCAADTALKSAADALYKRCDEGKPVAEPLARLGALIQERLKEAEMS